MGAKLPLVAASLSTAVGFTGRFAGEIRVAFNWYRFEREAWHVERLRCVRPIN
jgi:hypothetical protein